jgi:hypothetical protein
MSSISLAAAIQDLRRELSAAMQAGSNETLRFELGAVELELELEVERELGAEAKFKWFVVDAEAAAKRTTGNTQKIRLSLRPVDATGQRIQVGANDVEKPR